MIRLANEPGAARWLEQIRATGGCEQPVHLAGHSTVVDAATGEVLRSFDTADEGGRLAVRCRTRRSVRCESCARQHQGDTYHLVRAGLAGGKGIRSEVVEHPRLMVTLTAPSFGRVHRSGRCHSLRPGVCRHGAPMGCGRFHRDTAAVVGAPLCAACYDYPGHVLWHAHLGELWSRTMRNVRRLLAAAGGVPRSRLSEHLTVSFAKVAEYQRRGAVHVHAVVRLDGPEGAGTSPPAWATETVLAAAVRTAAGATRVATPYAPEVGERTVVWGRQLDIHPIGDQDRFTTPVRDDAVAAYIAKYTTKSATEGGTDYPVRSLADVRARRVPEHVRALMRACWRLGGLPELAHLRLRGWAHMLGFRGHVLTKSRGYSTTYKELRAARAAWQGGGRVDGTVVDSAWRYVGRGWTPGEAELARGVAFDAAAGRALAREAVGWVERGG
ncbi:replication initiator [Streptomyces radicis]|uniref:replication initiator n=1 Tax=Streptomyces radicis TaxID=1750517 RepID=UPI001E5D9BFC|nr:replication initiator [Streptomyces radicis]